MVEKLVLHILIVLMPVFVHHVLYNRKQRLSEAYSPYMCAVLQGGAVVLCLSFPFPVDGFRWDLRSVPLVLSFLYGGPRAGLIVLGIALGYRALIGGDTWEYGMLSILLTTLVPMLLLKHFWKWRPHVRVFVAMAMAMLSFLVSALMFSMHFQIERTPYAVNSEVYGEMAAFGLLQVAGIALAAMLNEHAVELSMMRREIQRAEKLNILGQLAASVAHEVRNPLTVVKGFLQIMHEEQEDPHRRYTQLVLSELARAESIINDYLNFAKPQMQKLETFELSEVMEDIVLLLNTYAAQTGVMLHRELEQGLHLRTDKNQLKQALVNLVKNAIEATPSGGEVKVLLRRGERHAVITILDTGKGMTKEQLSRIGTLFYTTKDKGTGLGTMVSLRIIESMKGRVQYESEPGLGTEVRIVVPLLLKK